MPELHEVKPREQAGRDSFARYRAQVRAAGIACLFILEGREIDAVFCDYQDDFVIRKNTNGQITYNFVQVKTKGKENHQWKLNETIGITKGTKKQSSVNIDKVKKSFIGKLLVHTVTFCESCEKVTFMTNIHFHNELSDFKTCIENKEFNNKHVSFLVNCFNECFCDDTDDFADDDIRKLISKLNFESDVQYIKDNNNNFEAIARDKIYQYSEIDLKYEEAKEILLDLLNLVADKSSGVVDDNITAEKLDEKAGVKIDDILEILSLSKKAYYAILSGNNEQNVLKTTSIIQRTLEEAGADRSIIDYCAQCKTDWDIWLRDHRNIISEFNIQKVTHQFDTVLKNEINSSQSLNFEELLKKIDELKTKFEKENLLFNLKEEHLLGGILASLVRFKS